MKLYELHKLIVKWIQNCLINVSKTINPTNFLIAKYQTSCSINMSKAFWEKAYDYYLKYFKTLKSLKFYESGGKKWFIIPDEYFLNKFQDNEEELQKITNLHYLKSVTRRRISTSYIRSNETCAFDAFKGEYKSFRILWEEQEEGIDKNPVGIHRCDCRNFCKDYFCVHSIAMGIKRKTITDQNVYLFTYHMQSYSANGIANMLSGKLESANKKSGRPQATTRPGIDSRNRPAPLSPTLARVSAFTPLHIQNAHFVGSYE